MRDNKEITVSAMESENKPKKQSFFKSRGFKYGSVATALTAVVIVVVIAANMLLTTLSDTYSWSLDVTSNKRYEVSDQAKQIVGSLDPDAKIEITVFYGENEYPADLKETLNRFANLSDSIEYKYIDPEKNPTALVQYGDQYSITSASIVVKCGDRIRVFAPDEYYEVDQSSYVITNSLEERLSAGVLYVTKAEIPTVYFLTGHGETGYTNLMNLIANSGADVKELNLLTDTAKVVDSAKLMVICNPLSDYSPAELRFISDFLTNGNKLGKNVMYFSSNKAYNLPNLEAFIKEWGISLNNDRVLDGEMFYGSDKHNVIPEFTTEEILDSGATISSSVWPIIPNSRSLTMLFEENGMYVTQPLVTTYAESSYSKPSSDMSNVTDKLEADKAGPFTLSALSAKAKYVNNAPVYSYMLVNGSSDMISEYCLNYTGVGEYVMQIYRIMVNEQDDELTGDIIKKSTSTAMVVSSTQAAVMRTVILIVLPLIFVVIGVVVFIRRRFL